MNQTPDPQLLAYLDSDNNQHGLDSIATHGFLTATVVGKPFANWLSALFEGHQDSVPADITSALQAWQIAIETELKDEAPISLPFASDDTEDTQEPMDFSPESDLSAWAVGFVDAMYADEADNWFADSDTEDDVAMLTLPMIVFSGIDEDDETLAEMRQDNDLLAQMANSLESNLTELYLLFHTDD